MESSPKIWSIPGKVFLLGEYAVLGGGPAWIATVGPRFWLEGAESAGQSLSSFGVDVRVFAPESPAGRLLSLALVRGAERPQACFDDPFRGSGGFGASTAQFALLYRFLAETNPGHFDAGGLSCWRTYRELMGAQASASASASPIPPSGADLAAQIAGGVCRFDPERPVCERQSTEFQWSNFLIFSAAWQAGRKAATHTHLAELGKRDVGVAEFARELSPILEQADESIASGDLLGMGRILEAYGDTLAGLGLEITRTREDREAIRRLPGVLGVKGAGALQADAVIVLIDPARADVPNLVALIEHRGLRFVGTADASEPGLRSESNANLPRPESGEVPR